MLIVKYTNLFKKDYKLIKKRGLNIKLLQEVVEKINILTTTKNYVNIYLSFHYKQGEK